MPAEKDLVNSNETARCLQRIESMKTNGLVTLRQGLLYGFIKGEFKFVIANIEAERINRDARREKKTEIDNPWVARLMIPKCDGHENTIINEFNPTVAEGKTMIELLDKIEQWYTLNVI